MKTAEEVAREVIGDARQANAFGTAWHVDVRSGEEFGEVSMTTFGQTNYEARDRAERWLAALIEHFRAEGAAAERERLAAHAERSAEEVAKELVPGDTEFRPTPGWHDIRARLSSGELVFVGETQDPKDATLFVRSLRRFAVDVVTRERAAAYVRGKADGAREAAGFATPKHVKCPQCNGSGAGSVLTSDARISHGVAACWICHGSGLVDEAAVRG